MLVTRHVYVLSDAEDDVISRCLWNCEDVSVCQGDSVILGQYDKGMP